MAAQTGTRRSCPASDPDRTAPRHRAAAARPIHRRDPRPVAAAVPPGPRSGRHPAAAGAASCRRRSAAVRTLGCRRRKEGENGWPDRRCCPRHRWVVRRGRRRPSAAGGRPHGHRWHWRDATGAAGVGAKDRLALQVVGGESHHREG
uniref:Uncharacterized protein n=1 Tax=Anopheles atroparvus TaxID=41427 RepID=A0AAG5D7R5_ANOAO